uniref:phospholipase A2 n=1 Tax=Anopheles darlingi TaxID=43151 RepID=A0A2M4CVS9_ANODA
MSQVKVHQHPRRQQQQPRRCWATLERLLVPLIVVLLSVTVTMTAGVQGQQQQQQQLLPAGALHPHHHHHQRHQQHHHHRTDNVIDFDNADQEDGDDGGGGGGGGGNGRKDHEKWLENFLLTDLLSDGERERRLVWNGIIGKETSIADNSSNKTLMLWQMATPNGLIQIIYNSEGEMMDCEYVRQRSMVHQFRAQFTAEFVQARARNFTSPLTGPPRHSLVSDHEFRDYIERDIVTPEMQELQYNVFEFPAGSASAPPQSSRPAVVSDAFGMRNLTYIPLRAFEEIPEELAALLSYQELKQRCNVRHKQLKEIASGLQSADPERKRIASEKLQRHKRAIADWFLSPNTKWCGKGHSASRYNQLGGASRADMCCRKHDHCQLMIPAMGTRWQLFNFGAITLSHCACDKRFRTCLKMADSSDANLVGKLFFNIMQMKCFVIKPETRCVKKSWWGKCEKKVRVKRAHLRDNRRF